MDILIDILVCSDRANKLFWFGYSCTSSICYSVSIPTGTDLMNDSVTLQLRSFILQIVNFDSSFMDGFLPSAKRLRGARYWSTDVEYYGGCFASHHFIFAIYVTEERAVFWWGQTKEVCRGGFPSCRQKLPTVKTYLFLEFFLSLRIKFHPRDRVSPRRTSVNPISYA